jgi:catechol 2,3-dioxygenase-like lactoylglutathione lyase family enzyme
MQIRNVIIKVDDQDKALAFYTSVVGFVKEQDVIIGGVRWLTVTAPEGADGVELVLEPNFPPSDAAQKLLFDAGFPAAVLSTQDIDSEFHRLRSLEVAFRKEPEVIGPVTAAFFEDTCGNVIALVQSDIGRLG